MAVHIQLKRVGHVVVRQSAKTLVLIEVSIVLSSSERYGSGALARLIT